MSCCAETAVADIGAVEVTLRIEDLLMPDFFLTEGPPVLATDVAPCWITCFPGWNPTLACKFQMALQNVALVSSLFRSTVP